MPEQAALTDFDAGPPAVVVDEDGDPVPPKTVGGFTEQDSYQAAYYRAPTRVLDGRMYSNEAVFQQYLHVVVKKDYGAGEDTKYRAHICEALERPVSMPASMIAVEATPIEAVEAAVEWLHENPALENPELVDRPGTLSRPSMRRRDREDQIEAVREGSTIWIDSLPESTVVNCLTDDDEDDSDDAFSTPDNYDMWMCETVDGEMFKLLVESTGTKPTYGYTEPGAAESQFREPEHVTSSNESNLRKAVATDTYHWLKNREGELVIHEEDDHKFEVIEIEELRDGFLNPSSGAIDPDGYGTTSGTHITDDEIGMWHDCPVDLEPGTYRVVDRGVVEIGDPYGANVLIPAADWDSHDIIHPSTDGHETTTALDVTLPGDRSTITHDDHVSEIIGVGDVAVEKVFQEKVGDLYEIGWPLPYISPQYLGRAIGEMYTIPSDGPGIQDSVRAVVGMLGGVAFDVHGENIGSTASCITGELDFNDAVTGWLHRTTRIRPDYCPGWLSIGDEEDAITALGTGDITVEDINAYLTDLDSSDNEEDGESRDSHRYQQFDAGRVALSPTHDKVAAVTGTENNTPFVTLGKDPLQVAATISTLNIGDSDELTANATYWVIDEKNRDGIIHLNSPTNEWGTVIDTSGKISPRDFEEFTAATSDVKDDSASEGEETVDAVPTP